MNKTLKVILIVIGVIVGVMFLAGFIAGFSDSYQSTNTSSENTGRNAFISACAKTSDDRGYCVCVIDQLTVLYPDFLYNEARLNRINEVGYYQNETDVMANCN